MPVSLDRGLKIFDIINKYSKMSWSINASLAQNATDDFCQVDRKGRRGGGGGPNSIATRHERTFADRILRSATDGRGRTDRSGLKMPHGRHRRPWQG